MTSICAQWWHYTTGAALLRIIASQVIRRADAAVPKGERAVVWFTCRATWEPTATKGLRSFDTGAVRPATIPEMVRATGPLVRLSVSDALARHTWAHYRRHSRIDPRLADALEDAARSDGSNPSEWRVSYHDIPTTAISVVEASSDGVGWTPVGSRPTHEGTFTLDASFVKAVRSVLTSGD